MKRQSKQIAGVAQKMVEAESKASQIEALIRSDSKRGKRLRYALQAILIELSNEVGIHVDHPAVVGSFYRAAALRFLDPAYQNDYHTAKNFRHIDLLLNHPSSKTVTKMINNLDGTPAAKLEDPFR